MLLCSLYKEVSFPRPCGGIRGARPCLAPLPVPLPALRLAHESAGVPTTRAQEWSSTKTQKMKQKDVSNVTCSRSLDKLLAE